MLRSRFKLFIKGTFGEFTNPCQTFDKGRTIKKVADVAKVAKSEKGQNVLFQNTAEKLAQEKGINQYSSPQIFGEALNEKKKNNYKL